MAETLVEFNLAFEQNRPDLLKQKSYQRKLKKLSETYRRYHIKHFDAMDSVASVNNQAILHALSGKSFNANRDISTLGNSDPDPQVLYHKGLIAMLSGDRNNAIAAFERTTHPNASLNKMVVLGQDPDYSEVLSGTVVSDKRGKREYNKGVLNKRAGDKVSALNSFTNALENRDEDLYRIKKAEMLVETGEVEKAVEEFRKLRGGSHSAMIGLGNALLGLGDYSGAKSIFKQYLESKDKKWIGEAYLGMANALYGEKAYAEAKRFYDRSGKFKSLLSESLSGVGNVALSELKYAQARVIFDRILSVDSGYLPAYLGRAIARYGLKDYKGAIEDFGASEAVIDISDKKMKDVLVCRGYSYYYSGVPEAAIRDFEAAVKLDGECFEALAGLGQIEIDRRKYSEAGKYLSSALRYQSDYDRLWANYGNLLMHFGMFEKATGVFKRAAELNPANIHAQNGRGVTLLERDQLDESKFLFDSLLRTNPGYPVFLNNRGIVQAYLGNRASQAGESTMADKTYKQAENDFNLAMKKAPAKKFYHVNEGNVFRYWQQYDSARLSYQAYQDKSALNNTAVLLAALERKQEARYYIGVALQLDSTHRVFQYNRGLLEQAKGMARFVASAAENGTYSDIGIKYSLDGYVTIYLYDYEYEKMYFPGRHHLTLPTRQLHDDYLIPEFDFSLLRYSENSQPSVKKKSSKMPKNRLKGRSRSGTRCPVLF